MYEKNGIERVANGGTGLVARHGGKYAGEARPAQAKRGDLEFGLGNAAFFELSNGHVGPPRERSDN